MNNIAKLTESQIEELAKEIRAFLLDNDMWQDVCIYFNGKRFTQRDPETEKYYYNDREHLFEEDGQNPEDYFEYVNPNHILSMSLKDLFVRCCIMTNIRKRKEDLIRFLESTVCTMSLAITGTLVAITFEEERK